MDYEQVQKPSSSFVPVQKKRSGFAPPASRVQAKDVTAGEQEQVPLASTPATDANWLMKHPLFKGNQFLQRVVAPASESESKESEESLAQRESVQRQEEGKETGTPYSLPVQAKLTIGDAGDKYEQEADRVAADVVQRIHAPESKRGGEGKVQRQEIGEEEGVRLKSEGGTLQRMDISQVNLKSESENPSEASADLEGAIQGARGSGQPLVESVREPMEREFGADFSGVRVHTDAQSDALNQAIQAKAFTTGEDIFFRAGAYSPGSRGGQELLAHELTHVVQQSEGQISETPTLVNNVAIQSKPLSYRSFGKIGTSIGETTLQRTFYWSNAEKEDVRDNDVEKEGVGKVFTKNGSLSQKFLKHCDVVFDSNGLSVRRTELTKKLSEGFDGLKEYSLGEKGSNLVDPVVNWLVKSFAAIKTSKKRSEPDFERKETDSKKRKNWYPSAMKGERGKQPGRLMNRVGSFAEGMLHQPQFVFNGQNVTSYTQVNDNATYSIGAYTVGGTGHLLGGSKSGERFGSDEAVKEMHAEEQQIAAFEDQVVKDAYGLKGAVQNEKVILHLHISKSPCSARCQGIINTLLTKYENLQIQMYLEIPYKANNPEEMVKEAKALKQLMENKQGRLAYQVVSVHNAKSMMEREKNPIQKWGGLEKVIYQHIQDEDNNSELAKKRLEKFEELVKKEALPQQGYVSGLQ